MILIGRVMELSEPNRVVDLRLKFFRNYII
jgi:hypothetical protein